VAISSTVGSTSVTRSAELVDDIRKLLSPFAEKKKADFAQILDLVSKLAGETPPVSNSQKAGTPTKTSPAQPSAASSGAPGSKSSVIPDELAYGFARGQLVPGTGLPVRIGWDNPDYEAKPEDMPRWDGRIPAGVPSGSTPFYTDSGHLTWLGLNGKMYDSLGRIEDNVLVSLLSERNGMSVSVYLATIRAAAATAGRPLTQQELYSAQAKDTGGRYATYQPVVTPEAERAAAALASRTSPFGYGVGQIVPGTGLPARIIGDGTSILTAAEMPAWDGRTPEHVPAGAVPFYSINGALLWLAGNGKFYDPSGFITDNVTIYLWASRSEMPVDAFVSAARAAGTAAGRALTLSEISSASPGSAATHKIA
jgi:hypothetical protein